VIVMTKKLSATTNAKQSARTSEPQERDATPGHQTTDYPSSALTRRTFLGAVGGVTAAAIASGASGSTVFAATQSGGPEDVSAQVSLPTLNRNKQSYKYRTQMAQMAKDRPMVTPQNNGDEDRYPNKIGSYS